MAIKLAAWNAEQRLTRLTNKKRGTPEHILQGIEALDADVLVMPEAFQEAPADSVDGRLKELGYEWMDARYDDRGREKVFEGAMPYMRVMSRLAMTYSEVVNFDGLRNMVVMEVEDPETGGPLRIVGVHLRDEAEWMRVNQIGAMAKYLAERNDVMPMPTVAAGDYNAMHGGDFRSRLIGSRTFRLLATMIPHARLRDVAVRASEMASGQALRLLEDETQLRDLDADHAPTATPKLRGSMEMLPSVPLIQIDHIYVSSEIEATDVRVAEDGGSDHRAISAKIAVR